MCAEIKNFIKTTDSNLQKILTLPKMRFIFPAPYLFNLLFSPGFIIPQCTNKIALEKQNYNIYTYIYLCTWILEINYREQYNLILF